MSRRDLTDKQKAMLLTLADRTGSLTTWDLANLINAVHNDEAFPELDRAVSYEHVRSVGRQLVSKGLATETGVKFGTKHWAITDEGRRRVDSIRGLA